MKKKIISIIVIILIITLYFFIFSFIYDNFRERKRNEVNNKIIDKIDKIIEDNKESKDKKEEVVEKKVYVNTIKYTVLGKIHIKRINFNQSILKENNSKSFNTSVVKIGGPNINTIGNVVIGGHNFMKKEYFYGIRKLKKGDLIKITDLNGISVTYVVSSKGEANANDASYFKVTKENTRELTLATCTLDGNIKYYVKAFEK